MSDVLNVGRWVHVDPQSVVQATELAGLQVLPSPYDVPTALRINEGNPMDPSYAVQVKYLSSTRESTRDWHADEGLEIKLGRHSGRLYELRVGSNVAMKYGRGHIGAVIDAAVDKLGDDTSPSARMVSKAIHAQERELVRQLEALGHQLRS